MSTGCRRTSPRLTFGSFGYRRALAAGSTAVGAGTLLAAFEGVGYNGPWDVPDNVRKLNGVLRYSQGTATDGFTLSAMAYSNGWNSTDQVAQRAIDQGTDRPVRLARSDRWRRLEPVLAVEQLGAIERIRAEQDQRLCRSTRRCGSTTISPTFSTIPSMAISSARWTGARSMASMPATPSMCASAASKPRPASGCRRAATTSVSACSRRCSARRSRPCAKTACGKAMSACGPIRRRAGPTGCAPRSASARIILRGGC